MKNNELKIIFRINSLHNKGLIPDSEAKDIINLILEHHQRYNVRWMSLGASRNYSEYLQSEHWRTKRKEIINKYGECYICGSKNELQVHHMTYNTLGYESEYDLICLCKDCHHKVHTICDEFKDVKYSTPCADKWYDDILSEIEKDKDWAYRTYKEIRIQEMEANKTHLQTLANKYCNLLGSVTNRKHLPKISRMLVQTANMPLASTELPKMIKTML